MTHPPKKIRKVPWWLWVAGPLAVAGLFGWNFIQSHHWVKTDDAYVKSSKIMISSPVSGQVSKVFVSQNQVVHQGDVLFQIDPVPFVLALNQAQAQLKDVDNQTHSARAQVQGAQSVVNSSNESIQHAQEEFSRLQKLGKDHLVPQQMIDNARFALDQAKQGRAQAQAQASSVQAQLGSGNQAELPPKHEQVQAQVDLAQYNLSHAQVKASQSGTIGPHDLQEGEYLSAGQVAMPLLGQKVWIEANFKETDLPHLKLGQTAYIEVDGNPDTTYTAHITSISPATGSEFSILPAQNATGNWVKIVQRVPVRLELSSSDKSSVAKLRSGLSAHVEVDISR